MYETHVTVQGRLVADPVVKESRHGPFTTFRVAQSARRQVRGEPGQWTDTDPSYYDVNVYRGIGENAARSLRKGHPVLVHGTLRIRYFVRGDGSSGTSVELEATSIGHDLRWGCTQYTRNGDLAPALASHGPALPSQAGPIGDPDHDDYVVVEGPSSPDADARHADTGPLVPPDREDAA
jgi:single-strand DNA-binding protein